MNGFINRFVNQKSKKALHHRKASSFRGKTFRAAAAAFLAAALAFTAFPREASPLLAQAAGLTAAADSDTRSSYKTGLGDTDSTRYSGRVWTDKSVSTEDLTFTGDAGDSVQIQKLENEDFLVTYSAFATSTKVISGQPADVVFILDLSASMCWGVDSQKVSLEDGSDSRIQAMVKALNSSIDVLAKSSAHNRIAIAVFNGSSDTLLELTEIKDIPGQVRTSGTYLTMSQFSGTTGQDDGKAQITSSINQKTVSTAGGTNIQAGLYEGMRILSEAKDTEFRTAAGGTVTRLPNVVLMSDGAPTTFASAADASWTDSGSARQHGTITHDTDVRGDDTSSGSWWEGVSSEAIGGGDNSTPHSANGFMALLTAAYMKNEITAHYYGTPDSQDAASVYTIGFSTALQTDGMAEMAGLVLDPEAHLDTAQASSHEDVRQIARAWEDYNGGHTPTVRGKLGSNGDERDYQVLIAGTERNPDSLYYPDAYYSAEDSDELNTIFTEIVSEIVAAAQVPTEVTGNDAFHDGYITYTDYIGAYMEIKDIRELIYGGTEFTQKDVRTSGDTVSYTFQGQVDSPVYGKIDAGLIEIAVKTVTDPLTREKTQELTVKIPAAAIPMRVNEITLNADGTAADHTAGEAYPIRVIYSVGTQDQVLNSDGTANTAALSESYLAANVSDSRVNFYSGRYSGDTDPGYGGSQDGGATVGDAFVTFTPAHTNPFYYVQENTPLYLDEHLNHPADGALDPDTVYYFQIRFYDGTASETAVVSRKGSIFYETDRTPAAAPTGPGGQLELQAGAPRLGNLRDFEKLKTSNTTGTAQSCYYPTYAGNGAFRVYLGNNGLLQADALSHSLTIGKKTETAGGLTAPDQTFTFSLSLPSKAGQSVSAVRKNGQETSPETLSFSSSGSVEFTLSGGETIAIPDIAAHSRYTVTEINLPPGYTLSSVSVNGAVTPGAGSASGIITTQDAAVEFTNAYTPAPVSVFGTGLEARKTVTAQSGSSYTMQGGEFSFSLIPDQSNPASDPVAANEALTNAADGRIPLLNGPVTYTEAGTYRYTVRENNTSAGGILIDSSVFVITVQVTDAGGQLQADVSYTKDGAPAAAIAFENQYHPSMASYVISGTKELTGGTMKDGQFRFVLEAVSSTTGDMPMPGGTGASAETANMAGSFSFGTIQYSQAGTYVYRLYEKDLGTAGYQYDQTVYEITVSVSDQGGALQASADLTARDLVFRNSYSPAPATVYLTAGKELTGRSLQAGEFSFLLRDEQGREAAAAVNTESGTIPFPSLTFDAPGTYYYTVSEESGSAEGITYDQNVYRIAITVKDDQSGHLLASVEYEGGSAPVFRNRYTAPSEPETPETPSGPETPTTPSGGGQPPEESGTAPEESSENSAAAPGEPSGAAPENDPGSAAETDPEESGASAADDSADSLTAPETGDRTQFLPLVFFSGISAVISLGILAAAEIAERKARRRDKR